MTTTMSAHFQKDRADRYAFIATTIGLGNVIHSYKQQKNKWHTEPCTVEITSTGIAIVKAPNGMVVTMYVLTISEAEKYFDTMPLLLAAVIRRNMKRRFHILQNQIKF